MRVRLLRNMNEMIIIEINTLRIIDIDFNQQLYGSNCNLLNGVILLY